MIKRWLNTTKTNKKINNILIEYKKRMDKNKTHNAINTWYNYKEKYLFVQNLLLFNINVCIN